MKKFHTLALASLSVLLAASVHAQFAGSVLDYVPGTGIAAGYTNASAALGAPALGSGVTPFAPPFSKSQLVSIGAGGEITLQMAAPIWNDAGDPYGINFIVFANEFFVNSSSGVSSLFYHSATMQVQVSADDVNWYTLNPALAPQAGELYPTAGNGNPALPVNPALTLGDFMGQNLAGIEALYNGSAGGTGYDLAWAQDGNGDSVDLTNVDFLRIEVSSGVLDLDAVSGVPEPGAWSLMLTGAAVIGWRGRKNKK